MGMALDTVGFYRTAGTAADADLVAATATTGDSFAVRSFAPTANAKLENIFFGAAHIGSSFRVRSPMMHDNVRGIQVTPGELVTQFPLPQEIAQPLISQDVLAVEEKVGTASETNVGALQIYYTDLLGASARLKSWGEIGGNIASIKPVEVDVPEAGTAGTWNDVVVTTTEDLLHANKDYAVLGYSVDNSAVAVGIKGTETANLRICGPAIDRMLDTSDYFVYMSNTQAVPHIPVINSANKDSLYVSLLSHHTGTTIKVQLILAELKANMPT
jgi:hypothetical protein